MPDAAGARRRPDIAAVPASPAPRKTASRDGTPPAARTARSSAAGVVTALPRPAGAQGPAGIAVPAGSGFSFAPSGRSATLRRTWLDTFDWRLYRAGLTLEQVT